MANAVKNIWIVTLIRWIARVIGTLYAAVMLLFVIASIFNPGTGGSPSFWAWFGILLMPIGVSIGMILAWKWELLGGLITLLCLLGCHLFMKIQGGRFDYLFFVDGIAIPAILFLLVWMFSRRQEEEKA